MLQVDLEEFTTRLHAIASNKPAWLPLIRAVVATTAATKLAAAEEATAAAKAASSKQSSGEQSAPAPPELEAAAFEESPGALDTIRNTCDAQRMWTQVCYGISNKKNLSKD